MHGGEVDFKYDVQDAISMQLRGLWAILSMVLPLLLPILMMGAFGGGNAQVGAGCLESMQHRERQVREPSSEGTEDRLLR